MNGRTMLYRMSAAALLTALVFLLGMTPLGLIPLGFINITVLCIPVIIGTVILGLRSGLLLGFIFGTVSTLSMIGLSMTPPSALASALFSTSPVLAILMCYIPRLAVPAAAYVIYKLLEKVRCSNAAAISVAAFAASLVNTVLYLGLMLLFYTMSGLDAQKILNLIAGTGLIAGSCEAVAAALITLPVVKAIYKTPVSKYFGGTL